MVILLVNTWRKLVSTVTNVTMDYLVLQVVAWKSKQKHVDSSGMYGRNRRIALKIFCQFLILNHNI